MAFLKPIDRPFTAVESVQRLKRLQQICKATKNDALLFIVGQDSLSNKESAAVLRYLVLGSCGKELVSDSVFAGATAALEDCVLVIKQEEVRIFYRSEAGPILLPIISSWSNLSEWTVSREEFASEDLGESIKIRSFLDMLAGCKTVGVPCGTDTMSLEKWPLIQTFGLESIQSKGFFTMNFTVSDITTTLSATLQELDTHTVRNIISSAIPLIARNWSEVERSLSIAESGAARESSAEEDIGEPLISMYEFGQIRQLALGVAARKERGSRVLLGVRTNECNTGKQSDSSTIATAGTGGAAAQHFVIEAEDPSHGVRVARTYFLRSTKIPTVEGLPNSTQSATTDSHQLNGYYICLRKALTAAVEAYASVMKNASSMFSRSLLKVVTDSAIRALKEGISSLHDKGLPELSDSFLEKNLSMLVERVDASGDSIEHLKPGRKVVYMRISLHNIVSLEHDGQHLGAVCAGDTIYIPQNGTKSVITEIIPYFRSWTSAGTEDEVHKVLVRQTANYSHQQQLQLGKSLGSSIPQATVLLGMDAYPDAQGSIQAFETGFVFVSQHFAPLIVSFVKDATDIKIYNVSDAINVSNSLSNVVVVINYKDPKTNPTLGVTNIAERVDAIAIPMINGTPAGRRLLDVLPEWRAAAERNSITYDRGFDVVYEKIVPSCISRSYADWRHPRLAAAELDAVNTCLIEDALEVQQTAFNGVSATSDLSAINEQDKDNRIPLTIFLGIPGSDVSRLAHSLMDVTARSIQWTVSRVGTSTTLSDAVDSQSVLKTIQDKIKAAVHDVKLPGRILLIVEQYIDVASVVIQAFSDSLRPLVRVASVVTCISATNIYRDPRQAQLLPRLLDQCRWGWPDAIILSRGDAVGKEMITDIKRRLHAVNPDTELVSFGGDIIEGSLSTFTDIRTYSSSDTDVEIRDAFYRGWHAGKYVTQKPANGPLVPGVISISQPGLFDRNRLVAYLSAITPKARIVSRAAAEVHPLNGTHSSASSAIAPPSKGLRLMQQLAEQKVVLQKESVPVDPSEASRATAPEAVGRCWGVHAFVKLADEANQWYEYTGSHQAGRLVVAQKWAVETLKENLFIFTGENLNASGLKAIIEAARPQLAAKKSLRTARTVTAAEKDTIAKSLINVPIPEGYFFDGRNYVDQYGVSRAGHPLMDEYIAKYIAEQNAAIAKENQTIEAENAALNAATR